MVHLPGYGSVVPRSRSGLEITAAYPELHALAQTLGVPAVLDGETVMRDTQGRPDFEQSQKECSSVRSPTWEFAELRAEPFRRAPTTAAPPR
ncbi:hypothetical protein SM007_34305 [Streptomyces avermitilis]|uniref:ATP-dependent DNA ligase family profile domain-containing protein n=1 Tax=Streptomyces avermitilis TaxID=33903 RepID=A0A4D4M8V6_STRAX|nr:hypothetical protein SM007_34305 [Streptomyces avermitilis]GDY68391.1 hypothetical protein SAV14893_077840 [Streptomyces avermitilis]GDY71236.1 hypothetical protein SAV31267_007210 [Streptomyces avermitilis]